MFEPSFEVAFSRPWSSWVSNFRRFAVIEWKSVGVDVRSMTDLDSLPFLRRVVGTAIQMQQQQQQQSLTEDIAVPSAPSETSDEGFSKQAICFDDNFKRNFLCRSEDGSTGSAIPPRKESAMDATTTKTTMTKDSQRLPPYEYL